MQSCRDPGILIKCVVEKQRYCNPPSAQFVEHLVPKVNRPTLLSQPSSKRFSIWIE